MVYSGLIWINFLSIFISYHLLGLNMKYKVIPYKNEIPGWVLNMGYLIYSRHGITLDSLAGMS